MKIYKIRNKDGKYSTGGTNPSFSKDGKTWSQRALNAHLTLIEKNIKRHNKYYAGRVIGGRECTLRSWKDYYDDCEIVTFEETSSEPLDRELFIRAL